MYEPPELPELPRQTEHIEEVYVQLTESLSGQIEPERAAALVAGLAVAAAQAVGGVCRREHNDGNYAELRPVYDNDGVRYCCTGDPQHCSTVIAQ
jgi:hypothetical protein